MQSIKEKNDCHPNQEVKRLSILPAEIHHQIHPPADHQKITELYRKCQNGTAFS